MLHQTDINKAFLAHQEGRLEEAESLYRQFVEIAPKEGRIWHLLGALCYQKGSLEQAEQYFNRAIELVSRFPEALNARGILFKEAGNLSDAEQDFRKALEYLPDFPQGLTNLADVCRLFGNLTEAKLLIEQALNLAPTLAPAYNNLGAIERDLNNFEEASNAFKQALVLDENLIEASLNLSKMLDLLGQTDSAVEIALEAIQKRPDHAPSYNCLGSLYFDSGRFDEAKINFKLACELDPTFGEAHNNFANTCTRLNNPVVAHIYYDLALEIDINNPNFWANKAAAFHSQNKIDDAIEACEKALTIEPKHADARWNRAIARLISGDLPGGFADYGARWLLPEFKKRKFIGSLWCGEELAGKSILVQSEQGFGDTFQFIRYITLISDQKPKAIYFETYEALRTILAPISEISQIFMRGDLLPESDYYVPLMDLPHLFGSTLETIPNFCPYLNTTYDRLIDLKTDTDSSHHLKIGLVWAGRATHKNDNNRSIPFSYLLPLTQDITAKFYSFQLGARQQDLNNQSKIVDLSPDLIDFAATASLLNQLDLIITVDTAIAHLAGAMGVKCWVMLPFAPDWRWLLDRNDSPWYPSLFLFRQPVPEDWGSVIELIKQKLNEELINY
jgi:tetratricopeptide (TPR) repeat protein